jgi:hypothetical protein
MTTPYLAELEAEERGWYEIAELVRTLDPEEARSPATTTTRLVRARRTGHPTGWPKYVQFEQMSRVPTPATMSTSTGPTRRPAAMGQVDVS